MNVDMEPVPDAIDPRARLLRRFAVDFLTGQDWTALPEIMSSAYRLNIGAHVIEGREERYRPAMVAAFGQFPGLCVTVHEVVLGTRAMAMHFTEHGASHKDARRVAAWEGISLFVVGDDRMQVGWVEEDYFARKRQLRSGQVDSIAPPHPAPWDEGTQLPSSDAEAIARQWLLSGAWLDRTTVATAAGLADDPPLQSLLRPTETIVDELFSAGNRVAFHATSHGTYAGGFGDVPRDSIGARATLRVAGIATTLGGTVVSAHLVPDRLGLQRSLLPR